MNTTAQEQQLIDQIKALPGHQVLPGRNGGSIRVARTSDNGVRQQSVWLGRSSTIENLNRVLAESFLDKIIVHMGDAWRVIGVGAQTGNNTFCHLASITRSRKQKNGSIPIQINDWVDTSVLKAAK